METSCASHTRQSFSDVSEQESALEGWAQRYAQSEPGAYHGSVERLMLPGITVSRERMARGVEQSVVPPEDRIVFVQGMGGAGPWRVNAEPCGPRFAAFIRSGEEHLADLPAQSDVLLVEVDAALLARTEEIAPAALVLRTAMAVLPPAPEVAVLAEWFAHLLAAPGLIPAIVPDLALYNLGRLFGRLGVAQAAPAASARSGRAAYRLFRRAEARLREAGGEVVSVAGLAAELGVPVPRLRQAFEQTVGVSPAEWLRRHRLDGARRDLLAGTADMTVTDVAMKWGFLHLGRFSSTYAAQFGESPSTTLRRCRPA
ncbi:helix-turn-helix domain-containing protein [Rhodovulum euryhalinum]|uniref:AraC-like DNA-binding protein n=1 Tax=Rhodovulum euryhalinum TaxID=35805 RepID=A0A4R2KHU5_9RHOB|nr:helix-turn-helix domain-containing protein [Rhodovulum euryhalinum]TCO69568.1 AraC-like DNA-binding protein [Rhodovulum euryhalinum]